MLKKCCLLVMFFVTNNPALSVAQIAPSPRAAARARAAEINAMAAPLAAAAVPGAAAQGTPRDIEVLLIADGYDPTLGSGFRKSLESVKDLFERAFPQSVNSRVKKMIVVGIDEPLTVSVLTSGLNQLTRSASVDEGRAIVCFYWMHGTQSPRDAQGRDITSNINLFYGHAAGMSQQAGLIPRYNLWEGNSAVEGLKDKNAGLTVLLSDSCFERAGASGQSAAALPFAALATNYGAQWRHLLEDYSGDVNITSSNVGELSWYLDIGLFTDSFLGFAESGSASLDWNQFYDEVRIRTNQSYTSQRVGWINSARDALTRQRLRDQLTQFPLAFGGPNVRPRGAAGVVPPGPVGPGNPQQATLDGIQKTLTNVSKDVKALGKRVKKLEDGDPAAAAPKAANPAGGTPSNASPEANKPIDAAANPKME